MTENDNEPDNCCCCPDDNCGNTCHSGCCYPDEEPERYAALYDETYASE